MDYDLIAIDLDGTALSSSNEVQHSTIEAVRYARERGVRVVLSTGRIRGEAAEFALRMGTDDYMVTAGGATVCDVTTGRVFHRVFIPWESAARAAEVVERTNMCTMVYADGALLVTPFSESVFAAYKTNEGYLRTKVVVPSVAQYLAENRMPADKLFTRCANAALLRNARKELSGIPALRVLSSAADNIEVIAPGTDKGHALLKLCAMLNVTPARCIAIGDSENDIDMLHAVGMPVAMGNADERVKELARYVTSDNNHGGVAQAIYQLLGAV